MADVCDFIMHFVAEHEPKITGVLIHVTVARLEIPQTYNI
jgi:hypothetical protein